jgi:hypothetical protein
LGWSEWLDSGKSTTYNQMGIHEDGRHSKMGSKAIKEYMSDMYYEAIDEFYKHLKEMIDAEDNRSIIIHL